jgi:hypothetical protein
MLEEREEKNPHQPAGVALPLCCHSGCTICVLDYPELFINGEPDAEMIAMLEAIEQAEQSLAAPEDELREE